MKTLVLLSILFLSFTMIASNDALPQSIPSQCPIDNTAEQTIFSQDPWWINKGPGPACQFPMTVFVNGVNKGTTFLLKFGHKNGNTWLEISAIYDTGYLRLVPPGLPYGTSFVLGPGYWRNDGHYVHNVQISRIDIDTTGATPNGPIHLTIHARDYYDLHWPDYRLEITYHITLTDPTANATQMPVTENFSVVQAFSLSASRQANHEGFKWAQFSSMYIDATFHDSDSALYRDVNNALQFLSFSDFSGANCGQFFFYAPEPLSSSSPWVEILHRDNLGWQGNTPNTIIYVNSDSLVEQITPQGIISCPLPSNVPDPNDDNVGMWINHDTAPLSFTIGDTGSINYTLIAQDNPFPFTDVPVDYWAWNFIEQLYAAGITGGCNVNPLQYCPEEIVTRAQMAVFLLQGIHNSAYVPPDVGPGTSFGDVPPTYWSAAFIKQLAAQGITTGCGNGNYCPENSVTRAQMAVFLLRSKHGPRYSPPAVGAGTGFGDVPPDYWAAAWIKQLVTEGITSGCGNGNYCPEAPVTRAQIAVFLVGTLNLP
jgi:hypothetical protein